MPYEKFEEYNIQVTDDVKARYKSIIEDLGENTEREGLLKTPERASKAMQFLTQGYHQDADEVLKIIFSLSLVKPILLIFQMGIL